MFGKIKSKKMQQRVSRRNERPVEDHYVEVIFTDRDTPIKFKLNVDG